MPYNAIIHIVEMKKTEKFNKGELIKADLCSRPNAINGKYKVGQLGLDSLERIKDSDIFFLETLRMKADLADKMIAEAESQGKDTSDLKVMKELGEEINVVGTPIHRSEPVMTAVWAALQLMALYGIAIAIWGIVFKKSILIFGIYGVVAGLLISLLFSVPVVAFQRTRERVKDMSFGVGAMWGTIGIAIGIAGLAMLGIRLMFF